MQTRADTVEQGLTSLAVRTVITLRKRNGATIPFPTPGADTAERIPCGTKCSTRTQMDTIRGA